MFEQLPSFSQCLNNSVPRLTEEEPEKEPRDEEEEEEEETWADDMYIMGAVMLNIPVASDLVLYSMVGYGSKQATITQFLELKVPFDRP